MIHFSSKETHLYQDDIRVKNKRCTTCTAWLSLNVALLTNFVVEHYFIVRNLISVDIISKQTSWMCPEMCLFCLHRNRWLGNIFLLLFEIISCGWTAVTFDCINILLCIVSPVSKVSWRYQRWLGNVLNKNAWIRVLFMEMHPRYFLYGVLWYFGILNVMYRF